jgi:transcriptional regulator with XRE-family HTH domain
VAGTISRATLGHRKQLVRLLVEAREAAGLSQRALAKRLRWPLTTIARVETLERRLEVTEFLLWCEALGVSPETLLRTLRRRR